jgi:hypothetical protein
VLRSVKCYSLMLLLFVWQSSCARRDVSRGRTGHLRRTGKIHSLEYIDIWKVILTRHHVGHCYTDASQCHCYAFCCIQRTPLLHSVTTVVTRIPCCWGSGLQQWTSGTIAAKTRQTDRQAGRQVDRHGRICSVLFGTLQHQEHLNLCMLLSWHRTAARLYTDYLPYRSVGGVAATARR